MIAITFFPVLNKKSKTRITRLGIQPTLINTAIAPSGPCNQPAYQDRTPTRCDTQETRTSPQTMLYS